MVIILPVCWCCFDCIVELLAYFTKIQLDMSDHSIDNQTNPAFLPPTPNSL
jgi:hypothetical protein